VPLEAGVHEVAVDLQRAHDLHRGRVAHVDLAQDGLAGVRRDRARRTRDGADRDGETRLRGDERAPLVEQEHLAEAAFEVQGTEEARGGRARVDGVQLAAGGREDRAPVGLDDVGFVDALLLDVGARGVRRLILGDGLRGAAGAGRGHRTPDGHRRALEIGHGTGPPDRAQPVAPRVAQERRAGAEAMQARAPRGAPRLPGDGGAVTLWRRRLPRTSAASVCARRDDQRGRHEGRGHDQEGAPAHAGKQRNPRPPAA
jgi:hypothetical protein